MYPSLGYRTPEKPSAPSFEKDFAIMTIGSGEGLSFTSTPITPQIVKFSKTETQRPKKFDGENQTASDWLMLFDLAEKANEWNAKQRLNHMPSFFEGAAINWYINRIIRMGELSGESDEEKLKFLEAKLKNPFPSASTHTGALEKMCERNQYLGENFNHYMTNKLGLIYNYNANSLKKTRLR